MKLPPRPVVIVLLLVFTYQSFRFENGFGSWFLAFVTVLNLADYIHELYWKNLKKKHDRT